MEHEVKVNEPYLFLDDELIAQQQGLSRYTGKAEKWSGNPILKADRPWEGKCVLLWGSVIRDFADDTFKIWYLAYNPLMGMPYSTQLCYATSKGGIEWERPHLGVYTFEGKKDNNIIFRDNNHKFDSPTVMIDPFDPPEAERFKMTTFSGTNKKLMRYASPDGFTGKSWDLWISERSRLQIGTRCSLM